MYTIDLLQGAGRPPRPRPLMVALTTLAFLTLVVLGGSMYTSYVGTQADLMAQQARLENQQGNLDGLQEIIAFVGGVNQRYQALDARMAEVGKALGFQVLWSPILTAISQVVPAEVSLGEISVTRHLMRNDPKKLRYHYLLKIGALVDSDPNAVESFIGSIRELEVCKPHLTEVRVANQRRRLIQDQEFINFAIECRVEP